MEDKIPPHLIPNYCSWVPLHQDDFSVRGNEEWTSYNWYCCTQKKVLSSFTIDEWGDEYGKKEALKKKCNCLSNLEEHIEFIPWIIRKNLRQYTTDKIILGKTFLTEEGFQHFKYLYENKLLTDYEFQVQNVNFPVHKIFISLVSPMFKQLFESSSFEQIQDQYKIEDENPQDIKLFLETLYFGNNFRKFGTQQQLKMMNIAMKFNIDEKITQEWIIHFGINRWFPKDEFNSEIYEQYRQLILSLPNLLGPYYLAEKIFQSNFPEDYTWDQNLNEQYDPFRTKINKYLELRASSD